MLDQSFLKEILNYNKETGIFHWKIQQSNRVHKGDIAGYKRKDGYILIGIGGRDHLAHRIAWVYVYGKTPYVIDHIDMDKSNNKICNLRDVNQSINMLNVIDGQSNNKSSKLRGVTFHKRDNKYVAQLCISGKKKFIGYFDNPESAHKAYILAKYEVCKKALEELK